jgi:hypothetical protein
MNDLVYKYWTHQLRDYKADFLKKVFPFSLKRFECLNLLTQIHFDCNYQELCFKEALSHECFLDLPTFIDVNVNTEYIEERVSKTLDSYELSPDFITELIKRISLQYSTPENFYLDHFDDYLNSKHKRAIMHYLKDKKQPTGLKVYLRKQYNDALGARNIYNVQKLQGNVIHLELNGDCIREEHIPFLKKMLNRIMEHKDVDAIFSPDLLLNSPLFTLTKYSITKVSNYYWGENEAIIGIENLTKI